MCVCVYVSIFGRCRQESPEFERFLNLNNPRRSITGSRCCCEIAAGFSFFSPVKIKENNLTASGAERQEKKFAGQSQYPIILCQCILELI